MSKRHQFVISRKMIDTLIDIRLSEKYDPQSMKPRCSHYDKRTLNALSRRGLIMIHKAGKDPRVRLTAPGGVFTLELRAFFVNHT